MAELTAESEAAVTSQRTTPLITVVAASTASTAFEWYDFFIFGSLVQTIGRSFFSALGPTAALVAALALFGVGFAFRPLGALIFGRVGDRIGRKAAFFVCVTLMGVGTFSIGLLPTAAQIGAAAPALLIALRVLQGLALGGQYGGAVIYVAEHAPKQRRGLLAACVQSSAALGLVAALAVIWATRLALGEAAFEAFGWRVPFFASAGLVAISIWMRLKLEESPAFAALKAAGGTSRAPWRETFGRWRNLKLVLIAFVALMSGQGAYWYTVFFYVNVFLQRFARLDAASADQLILFAAVLSAPLYVFFGALSDRVGRKPVMWAGMTLGLAMLFPGFHALLAAANPTLVAAERATPVIVAADAKDCSWQFDVSGRAKFVSSCDIAKAALANTGVGYRFIPAPAGQMATVRIGATVVLSVDGRALPPARLKAATAGVESAIGKALARADFPSTSDPARRNVPVLLAVLAVFVIAATALYGPMAASLAELFPARIRYTGLSLPYHVGTGWIGGFQPVVSFSVVVATGNVMAGLWYPAMFTAVSVVACLVLLPETRGRSLEA